MHRLRRFGRPLAAAVSAAAAGSGFAEKLQEVKVVGGHGGILGDGTTVFKPMQKGARGQAEASFYRRVFKERGEGEPPASFMPGFKGIVTIRDDGSHELVDGPHLPPHGFIVLEDVTHPFMRPSIMDIKMGVQAWGENATPAKIEQERSKYPTQQVVGFRFTGMRVWQPAADRYKEHGRAFGYALDERSLHHAFYEYLHDGDQLRTDVIPPLLDQLTAIRAWFATQSDFRFYGSSLLFVYDGADPQAAAPAARSSSSESLPTPPPPTAGTPPDAPSPALRPPRVDVRMIDFAHVWPIRDGPHGRDEGYLKGLDNVIGYLTHLQEGHAQQQQQPQRHTAPSGTDSSRATVADTSISSPHQGVSSAA